MARQEAIVIVLDIGHSVSNAVGNEKSTFLDLSKKCVSRIVERKIFSSTKDEIALVILGCEDTHNTLDYEHISLERPLSLPSWKMLKTVDKIVGTSVETSDWVDALVVAMDILENDTLGKKFTAWKIVLLSNLKSPVSEDQLNVIIKGMQKMEIELNVIGVDVYASETPEPGEILMQRILEEINGISCSFDTALSQLKFYPQVPVRMTPWNVCLDIGPDIKIPVSGYKKVAPAKNNAWKRIIDREHPDRSIQGSERYTGGPESSIEGPGRSTGGPESSIEAPGRSIGGPERSIEGPERSTVYFSRDENPVDKSDKIRGFRFGSSFVPVNDEDKEAMKLEAQEKCLSVLQFVPQADVPRHLFTGDGAYYIQAQKGNLGAEQAVSALIHVLYEKRKAAIVRKVYNKISSPVLGALFPLVKKEYECLLFIELPFSDDIGHRAHTRYEVDPEDCQPEPEDLEAADALMKGMDLRQAKREGTADLIRPKTVIDIQACHEFQCLAHRAVHGDKSIPGVGEDIQRLLKHPFEEQRSYREAADLLGCDPEQPEPKPKKVRKGMMNNPNATDQDMVVEDILAGTSVANDDADGQGGSSRVVAVGIQQPEQDFTALVKRGVPFRDVCKQMQGVLLQLMVRSFGPESLQRAQAVLAFLRSRCVERDPHLYNDWLTGFKNDILSEGRTAFWEFIIKENKGLISSAENPESTVTSAALEEFAKLPESAQKVEEELDIDDLIDQM